MSAWGMELAWVGTLALGLSGGCSAPLSKSEVLDSRTLSNDPVVRSQVRAEQRNERSVRPNSAWLADVDPTLTLTFLALRSGTERSGPGRYYVLVGVIPATTPLADDCELVLMPLDDLPDPATPLTPLDVLADPARRDEFRRRIKAYRHPIINPDGSTQSSHVRYEKVYLSNVIAQGKFAPPIPDRRANGGSYVPVSVFAAAVNFPSHLNIDIGIDYDAAEWVKLPRYPRARVFLKSPAVPPPPGQTDWQKSNPNVGQWIGAFDTVRFPAMVAVPAEGGRTQRFPARVDYEVEIAVVLNRDLRASEAARPDAELARAVGGYVLAGDTKVRNPQVMQFIRTAAAAPDVKNDYQFDGGRHTLDRAFGPWDSQTCQWWSYAAGYGTFFSAGPLFVEADPDGGLPPHAVIAARTYGIGHGNDRTRHFDPNTFYLRQASTATDRPGHKDALVWPVHAVIRSILTLEGNALTPLMNLPADQTDPVVLHRGDVICLGTPGGVALTSRTPPAFFAKIKKLMPFASSQFWYELALGDDSNFLHSGDQIFYWASGLGYQRLNIAETIEAAPRN